MHKLAFVTALFIVFQCSVHTFIFLYTYISKPRKRHPVETVHLTTMEAANELLQKKPVPEQLQERALANERLVRAFGIQRSTFTSASPIIHNEFRNSTVKKLRAIGFTRNGEKIRDLVEEVIQEYLPCVPRTQDYAKCVQVIVFVVVLRLFFDYSASDMPEASEVHFVTQSINNLWQSSKMHDFKGDSDCLRKVNYLLKKWINTSTSDRFSNAPLELLLPAYETMWRLVAHALPHLATNPEYLDCFEKIYSSPTYDNFNDKHAEISGHEFVNEVLRLHPPTKRIKRVMALRPSFLDRCLSRIGIGQKKSFITVAVDIESIHRSSDRDHLTHELFVPERHSALTAEQKAAYMPFGIGPLKCVAFIEARLLAGIIIACFARRITDGTLEIIPGKGKGDREGWEGWMAKTMAI